MGSEMCIRDSPNGLQLVWRSPERFAASMFSMSPIITPDLSELPPHSDFACALRNLIVDATLDVNSVHKPGSSPIFPAVHLHVFYFFCKSVGSSVQRRTTLF